MQKKPTRRTRTSRAACAWSRRFFVTHLHRPPCRWDVLIHEFSQALAKTLAEVGQRLSADTFIFGADDAELAGWVLAKGFDVLVSQGWPRAEGADVVDLWPLTADTAARVAGRAAEHCFDPLLRKYVWDSRGIYAGTPHRDLPPLIAALSEGLRDFLTNRCLPSGNLAGCLAEPAADAGEYFPAESKHGAQVASSGDHRCDVQRLALTINDQDDGGEVKRKLVHLVRDDPWLFAEWRAFVQQEQRERGKPAAGKAPMAIDRATDDFIFRATRLDGMTPIQLLLDRQPDMANCQRHRLLRWDAEVFLGAFHVHEVSPPHVKARDVEADRELLLEATKGEALRDLRPGDLLLSRAVPWYDHWLLSGVQQRYQQFTADRVREMKAAFQRKPLRRRFDIGEPRFARAFAIQEQQHQAWLALFGRDEMLFADGLELGAAMHRFYRYWSEALLPGTDLSRIETFRRQYGKEPPDQKFPLPEDLLKSQDVAAIFDRQHGLSFFVGYGVFLSAFQGQGSLSEEQVDRVWGYLSDESVEYWVFQRMAERYPDRAETVLSAATRDSTFLLRDLDVLLRRFKGEAMRQPVRPMISMVDVADGPERGPRQASSP